MNVDSVLIFVTFGAIGAAAIGLLAAAEMDSSYDNMRSEAIERGYALYCPNDGKWNWVGECDE